MLYEQILDSQQAIKQKLREADDLLLRQKSVSPADLAKRNSCFGGVNLHAARSKKGFNLF